MEAPGLIARAGYSIYQFHTGHFHTEEQDEFIFFILGGGGGAVKEQSVKKAGEW